MIDFRRAIAISVLSIATIAASGRGFAQQNVGVSGATNPDVTGAPSAGPTRQLTVGQDISFNERVTSGASGQTQLLFLDQSRLTLGPNSDVVVDQFVYDPNTNAGKMAMNVGRGVFRFVGGKISKSENAVTVQTADGTLGIRGGIFLLYTGQPCAGRPGCNSTEAIFVFGKSLSFTGRNGVTQTVTQPGYELVVGTPGGPATAGPASHDKTAAILAYLDGHPDELLRTFAGQGSPQFGNTLGSPVVPLPRPPNVPLTPPPFRSFNNGSNFNR